MKVYDILSELATFTSVSDALLNEAKQSNITTRNNSSLRGLVKDWVSGIYDEDPDMLVNEISFLIK